VDIGPRLVCRRWWALGKDHEGGPATEIDRTTFGTIKIDGKTYEHDVSFVCPASARRKKQLSKKY